MMNNNIESIYLFVYQFFYILIIVLLDKILSSIDITYIKRYIYLLHLLIGSLMSEHTLTTAQVSSLDVRPSSPDKHPSTT